MIYSFVVRVHLYRPSRLGAAVSLHKPHSVLHLMPISFQVRASLVEAPLLSASTNDRFGIRVDRLRPPACHSLNPDTAPASRCRIATVCTYGYKLSLTTTFSLSPPLPIASPVLASLLLRCQPVIAFGALLRKETSACYSDS